MEYFVILFLVFSIVCWACYKRKLAKAVYGLASLEIMLQIFAFVANNIGKKGDTAFISKTPNSLLAVADKFTSGIVYTILAWAFVLLMIYFLFVTIKLFLKK